MKRDQELVDYFIGETNKKFDLLSDDVRELRKDIFSLKMSRTALLARISILSAIVSAGIEIAIIAWEKM